MSIIERHEQIAKEITIAAIQGKPLVNDPVKAGEAIGLIYKQILEAVKEASGRNQV
ncbi:hypothetical protein [Gorillibacterium sp. sgz5001074]|uniref:hypothetical protein n=1 Tax=Gorillibacterium sp. sgz5001074 TaxID=3446695 RepID=UPI003F67F4DA